eukprot:7106715-Lingulodinium_polyedra.AAC.1
MLQYAHSRDGGPGFGSAGINCDGEGERVIETLGPNAAQTIPSPEDGGRPNDIQPVHFVRAPVE